MGQTQNLKYTAAICLCLFICVFNNVYVIFKVVYNFVAVDAAGFTRLVVSLWAMTMLSLYIRTQVNILGRHLYIDTARGLESSHLLVRITLFFFAYTQLVLID